MSHQQTSQCQLIAIACEKRHSVCTMQEQEQDARLVAGSDELAASLELRRHLDGLEDARPRVLAEQYSGQRERGAHLVIERRERRRLRQRPLPSRHCALRTVSKLQTWCIIRVQ